MLTPLTVLLTALGAVTLAFIVMLVSVTRARPAGERAPSAKAGAIGMLTAFFDTLGIGSFATTTSLFRQGHVVDDADMPGTLNVGIALPTVVQAFIYTRLIPVDPRTLILMIVASVAGAWLGAGIVSRWPKVRIQLGMGTALIIAALIMLGSLMALLPAGGNALALTGAKLFVGIAGNFVLGALMTLGIGLYAPCMILVSLLGLTPTAAFPIMMGSCAFLMPIASARFVHSGRYNLRAALGLTIGSIPGVLLAAFIVKSLPLTAVRWLVIVVVLYTAATLLRAALRERVTAPLAATPS